MCAAGPTRGCAPAIGCTAQQLSSPMRTIAVTLLPTIVAATVAAPSSSTNPWYVTDGGVGIWCSPVASRTISLKSGARMATGCTARWYCVPPNSTSIAASPFAANTGATYCTVAAVTSNCAHSPGGAGCGVGTWATLGQAKAVATSRERAPANSRPARRPVVDGIDGAGETGRPRQSTPACCLRQPGAALDRTIAPRPRSIATGRGGSRPKCGANRRVDGLRARARTFAQPRRNHLAEFAAAMFAGLEAADPAAADQVGDRRLDLATGRSFADVVEQQREREDGRQRRCLVGALVLRRAAVDALEHRYLAGVDVARGGDAHAADQHGAEVGDDVAEQVGRHRDVEPLRCLDHPHARRVDVGVVGGDARILARDVGERARPQILRAHGVRLVDERDLRLLLAGLGPALLREFERVADDALGAAARVDHLLQRDLVFGALLGVPEHAGVGVLGVLAAEHHVDVGRRLALERAQRLVVELDRPQVHVEVELVPQTRDDRELELADLDARIADRAEQHGVHRPDALERRVGHRLASLQEVLGAVRHRLAFGAEAEDLLRGVEDTQRRGDDLLADAVARQDTDVVDLAHLVSACSRKGGAV